MRTPIRLSDLAVRPIAAGALVAALMAGCGSDGGGTGGGGGAAASGGGGSEQAAWISGACGVCYSDACGPERDACAADPGCALTRECVDACPEATADGPPTPECVTACAVPDSSSAQAAFDALEACRTTGLGAACPTCGQDAGACPPEAEDNACKLCAKGACCESVTAYEADPEAAAIFACQEACNFECEPECMAQHPDGVLEWGTRLACLFEHCATVDTCVDEPNDPCVQCDIDLCSPQRTACWENVDCYQIGSCVAHCEGPAEDCNLGCIADFPAGEALYNAHAACVSENCLGPCGG